MSNKSNGTAFEREFAELLSANGFWAHLMQDNRNGQPFDVIAARDGLTYVFDCKDCQSGIFNTYRIEENQKEAMKLWLECGNQEGLFVIRFPEEILILPYTVAMKLIGQGVSSITANRLRPHAIRFERWLEGI